MKIVVLTFCKAISTTDPEVFECFYVNLTHCQLLLLQFFHNLIHTSSEYPSTYSQYYQMNDSLGSVYSHRFTFKDILINQSSSSISDDTGKLSLELRQATSANGHAIPKNPRNLDTTLD